MNNYLNKTTLLSWSFMVFFVFQLSWGQTWTYDFGSVTGTSTNTDSGSGNTGFFTGISSDVGTYSVRIGTSGGSLELANPGTSLGTESEVQLTASNSISIVNKFGVYEWDYPSTVFFFRGKIRSTSTGNGIFNFSIGTNSIVSNSSSYTSDINRMLVSLNIEYNATGSLYRVLRSNLGSKTTISNSQFSKDTDQDIEVYANNGSSSVNYYRSGSYTLVSQTWDLWVGGIKVVSGAAKAGTLANGITSGTNLSGFCFYGLNSMSNVAKLFLDDFQYSNTLPNNTAPVATSVSILGATNIDQTLTGSYTYSDGDSDVEGTSTYKWYRADDTSGTNSAEISSATSSSYLLQLADSNKYIRFSVVPIAQTGIVTGESTFSSWQGPVGAASTTWDGLTWSDGVPTSFVDVSITGDLTTTGNISCDDLTINSGKTLTVASGYTLSVAGNIVNNGAIIFKSDNSGTANFDQFSGTISGSGNVTVERYLPAKRGWRLLTSPLKGSSGNTVASNWQGTANEGLLLFSPATYQTQTMIGYTTGGVSPNIWKYNSVSTQWQSIANVSAENLFTSTVNNGFLVFATGPSDSSNIASGSSATTLKPVGQLITGSVNYALTANKYHLIGNPYASPLDTEVMVQSHANSKAYMVDPTISSVGGYVTYDGANWTPLTPTSNDKYIQSGQGFFLKSTTEGTFTIAESHKASGNSNTWFERSVTDTSVDKIRVLLYKQNNSTWQLTDGILAVNSASGNDEVDATDVGKMSNFNENILFKNGTSNLAIEYRGFPTAGTLQPMQLTGTTAQSYELHLKTENYSNSNLTPYLENTQTGALTAIPTDGSEVVVSFSGIAATSAAPDTRYRIVYQSALHLEETNSLAVGVYPNPVIEGIFTVVVPQANTLASYTLTNLLSQEVQKGTLLTTNNSIHVQQLTPGVYLLQVNHEGKQFTTKIMIN
ncbi:MAG: T9SS type A sorting domain-containing protein [Flavobacterium sp.]|nr:T9SS type A sorting domain-containing protein [Flavobacterium sp.]